LDKDNNIIIDQKSPCLYCSFPLIGSESFELPFIINSPDFEPDSERQTILLDGNDVNEESGKISDPGINKMILRRSQEAYKTLIDYICNNDIKSRYLLARGLKSVPYITRFFDREWYEKNYMIPMREILIDFPIILNGKQYNKLTEKYLPMIEVYNEIEDKNNIYSFMVKLYNNEVPSFEESKNIEKYIWLNDERIKYINLEKCVQYIESNKNMNSLSNKINDIWNWYDDFLVLIKHFHPEYLEKYAIIPNMYSDFVKLTNGLSSSKDIPENMIECLLNLGIDWKKNHFHNKINKYSTRTDHNIEYAVSMIIQSLKNNFKNKLILIHYVPYDGKEEYIKERNLIFEFCSVVWKDEMTNKKDGNKFPKELWDKTDNEIIEKIIEEIVNKEKIGGIFTAEFMLKFLEFLLKNYPNFIYYKIIPNQNEKFCSIIDLYEDDNIPEEFKKCLNHCFDVDIKENLLDKRFTSLKLNISKKIIYDYKDILRQKFLKSDYKSYLKKEAAVSLIKNYS